MYQTLFFIPGSYELEGPWSGGADVFGPLTKLRTVDGKVIWDLSLLFEDAFILLAPLLLVSTLVCAQVARKSSSKFARTTNPHFGRTGSTKIILYSTLVATSLTHTVCLSYWGRSSAVAVSRLSYPAAAVTLFCALLVTCVGLLYHTTSLRPLTSCQLLLGWWIVCDVVTARTRWLLGGHNRILAVLVIASAASKLCLILVEEWSKRKILVTRHANRSPEELSGIYNRLMLAWLNPMMYRGLTTELKLSELWPLEKQFCCEALALKITRTRRETTAREHLIWTLFKAHWYLWVAPIPIRLLQAGFTFAQPFLIQKTIIWLFGLYGEDSKAVGFGLLGAYAVVYVGMAIATSYGQYQIVRWMVALRGDLIIRIYEKTLQGKSVGSRKLAPLTLMSTNVSRIHQGFQYLHEAFISVFTLAFALWLLQRQVGLGAVAPIIVVAFLGILIGVCVPGIIRGQKTWLNAIQARVGLATQLMTGFQSVKMSGLVNHLAQKLQESRTHELNVSLAARRYQTVTNALGLGAPELIPVLALAVYVSRLMAVGDTLTLDKAFAALSYMVLIALPLLVLLSAMPIIIAALASLNQIDAYLHENPLPSVVSLDEKFTDSSLTPNVTFILRECTIEWSKDKPILQNLSFECRKGLFTFIIGPSASGKSTLLEVLLGGIDATVGTVARASRDIAFVAQTPWIRNASVQSNIIGSNPLHHGFYQQVIKAVALEHDIEDISRGDVGTGGISLSGGQRQKVSLARALYSRRSIVVIDEPFTGVDGISSEQITQRLFGRDGFLRRHSITLVLASHSAKNVRLADHAIVLSNAGSIVQQGPPTELNFDGYRRHDEGTRNVFSTHQLEQSANPLAYINVNPARESVIEAKKGRRNDWAIYRFYFSSLGWKALALTLFLVSCLTFFQLFPQYWVTWWATSNYSEPNNRLGYWIGLYATWAFMAFMSIGLACYIMLCGMVQQSGSSMHEILARTVAKAPVSLFVSVSPGFIVNRFSKDMSTIDVELPISLGNTAIGFVLCLGQLIIVVIASKFLAISIPVVLIVAAIIQQIYVRTSRQLRLLSIESLSPLYSHFIETLNGLTTVRAYGMEDGLRDEMYDKIDVSQRPFYLLWCAQRYLGLSLDLTVAGLVVLLLVVANLTYGQEGTGYYGVALVNIMTFGFNLTRFIDQWCQFEIGLAAVERTKEFAEVTEQETTIVTADDAATVITRGELAVTQLSVEYKSGIEALHKISLQVPAGQKVAICGRSGSGKSTLCFALLRMLEATHGSIQIDDRDISQIPHEILRGHLSCVPQTPLILDGTVCYNLDPLMQRSVEELDAMMVKVGLVGHRLDNYAAPDTLSFAEKQLICLARALLKQKRVLVLDEATSSVDAQTDEQVQSIVCALPEVTVLSVMHRFDHIRTYDRIIVMSEGRIVEDGTLEALLARPSSQFSELYMAERQG